MNLGLVSLDFRVDMLVAPLRALAEQQGKWRSSVHAKGQAILQHGDVTADIFILQSGLVKLVYPTANGDEWIKSFIVDRGLFGSVDDGDAAQPSRFAAICIEPSMVARLPLAWVKQAIAEDAELTAAYVAFSGWVRRRKEEREEALLCKSPKQSYLDFIADNSGLAERLPQGDIARYLGITPVAFSRIKRRLRS
jgi:CRP/FNR family transcriptional regulator, anaerobic regulatory protein